MVFAYYHNLSTTQQRAYRLSDAVVSVKLAQLAPLRELTTALAEALETGEHAVVQRAAGKLTKALYRDVQTEAVVVKVLSRRPHSHESELHGLYTREEGKTPVIEVWMRTASHKRVVAFRTFLRTLIHEFGHHLDYSLFRFSESFHTEGFFQREANIFRQLVPAKSKKKKTGRVEKPTSAPSQLELPLGENVG